MKMAKATQQDIEASLKLMTLLQHVDDGNYPSIDEDTPSFFDEDDPDHLLFFYQKIKVLMDEAPGFIGRVVGGFHTLMNNDLVDPDLDYLELHPRLRDALKQKEGSDE